LSAAAKPFDFSLPDLRALVEQVEDYAMFMLDLGGYVATWNRGAQKIKQYAPDQIIGKHFSVFYPPEDLANRKPQRELEIVLAEGHVEDEGWRLRRDGTRFWAFVSITLLRDERGEPRGFAKVTRDLTERRRTEEALRLSEERFRMLVDGVADYAIYMLDPHGVVSTWNAGARKIKGYEASEIIGRHFEIFFSEEDRRAGRPRAELEQAAREGRFEEEAWRVRSDGTRFWAHVVVRALHNDAGELAGFSKVTRDLTARKQAEETARELERQNTARMVAEAAETRARQERERFRALSRELDAILEGVVDGITVQDRSGRLLFANSAAARQIGVASREELLSMPAAELVKNFEMLDEHGNLVAAHSLPGRRVLAGEQRATALLQIRDKRAGRSWWSLIRANGVKATDGSTDLAINIWHDVSAERQRDEHERYLANASAALSTSLDYQGTLETLAQLLVPGLCDWCVIHLLEGGTLKSVAVAHADPRKRKQAQDAQAGSPSSPNAAGAVWQVIRSGEPILYGEPPEQLEQNAASPERYEVLKGVSVRSQILVPIKVREQVLGALTLIASESGRRYDEQDLKLVAELGRRVGAFIENARLYESAHIAAANAKAAAREAESAGRLKDEFLATVSHELRTPLNAIMGWSALLKTRSDPASIEKGIDVIHRNAKAQSKIIEDILDVSRIITGKLRIEPAPVNLVTIVSESIEVVRPSAIAQGITIELSAPAEPLLLIGDAQRLQQVIWNLLSNAVKFNVPGGRVALQIEQRGSQITLTVTDNGKGIEREFLPYVFERFKQADGSTTRRYGGLGLGLAIVRHIVELHGGSVAVASDGPGLGSTFTISLPVRATMPSSDAASERPSRAPQSNHASSGTNLQGVRVLVVDDERDARELLEVVLRQAGAQVMTAESASTGIEALGHFAADIVISDIGMPDQDGYAFMHRLRALAGPVAAIPAIALTAYTRQEDKLRALALGFTTHIGKPVNPDDLTASVARLVSRRMVAAP
jgi:PAS domain S-box-containing protein